MDQAELRKAAADLARIDEAGMLDELTAEVFHELRDRPAGELDSATANQELAAQYLAEKLRSLFRAPEADCLAAATEAVISTRRQVVTGVIARYICGLDGTTPASKTAAGTPAAIERARRKAAK